MEKAYQCLKGGHSIGSLNLETMWDIFRVLVLPSFSVASEQNDSANPFGLTASDRALRCTPDNAFRLACA